MKTIREVFTDQQWQKLETLASRRGVTVEAVLRRLADAIVLDGYWKHPTPKKITPLPKEIK